MSPVPDTAGPFVLGIDFGTESCRAAIFDLTGRPVTFAATGYTTTHPRPGWAEQSPDDWWEALVASVRKAMADSGIPAHAIAALSYDATTCTVVALDERGDALRPAIMWMDVRATEQAARAGQSTHPARRYNGGGTMPATAEWFPFKAAWLKDNEPDTYAAAYRIVDAPDWVTFRLTGRWTANINSAALRAYYDRDLGGWPTGFYEEIGCADVLAKVPDQVVALGQPIGELTVAAATALGLRPGTLVAQGCADAWAGQIGLGVLQPGKMALITGSSHVLTGQTDQRIHGQGFFGAYTDGVLPGQYTVEGGQVSTGSVLKWFKDNYCRDLVDASDRTGRDVYEVLNHRSRDIPIGSDGLIVCEYWQGNRTPYTDSKARGIVWGLTLHHGPEHLYHAIQEGVCYGTAHILRSMTAAGFAVEEIVACGGATRSRDWVQMHSDVTGVPVTLTEVGDAVVLGACMLAATGAGLYPDLAAAGRGMVHEVDRVEPDPARHGEYQFFVDRYCDTYPLLRPLIHDMADHVVQA